MDAIRWERVQTLFHHAAALPDAERAAFLDAEAAGDADLADRVRRLLAADGDGGTLIDRPLGAVAGRVLAEPLADLSAPDVRFGPYRVVRPVGEGGMGVVYLAERDDLRSRVAVKVLRDAWLSPGRRERFAAEQRTLAQLNHPGIARLYDAGTLADGTPWIAMEYVDGVTLVEHCRARRCTLAERLTLFRAVCDAVQHAHRHLVVHRDLKPSNVMVTEAGPAPAKAGVKLLDFGIAKQLEPDAPADATRTGMRAMTPAYAAPEQLRGAPVGVHTDVYALGVMLYELLSGRLPFDVSGHTPEEAATRILSQAAERASAAARRGEGAPNASAAAWADLDVLCATAMHPDPQRRYATVDALARDVDHFLHGEPLDARPDGVRYRLGKLARRHRGPLAAAAAVVVGALALVGFYTARLADARDAAVAEAARTERVLGFTTRLFRGDDDMVGPVDSLRVVTLLDRGVRDVASLSAEPSVKAEMLATLGKVYTQLGRFARADSLLRASLAARRALFGDEHADVVATRVALAEELVLAEKADEGERMARDALATSRRVLGPTHATTARALYALGLALQQRAAYDSSIALLGEAVRVYTRTGASTPELLEALGELANSNHYAGHLDAADSLNQRALAMDRAIYGDRHPAVGDDLINVGAGRVQRGDYAGAEPFLRQGVAIFAGAFGPESYQTAGAESVLAEDLLYLERRADARSLLVHALPIQERAFGPINEHVATTRLRLANASFDDGDYDGATAGFMRVLAIYRALHGNEHPYVATVFGDLTRVAFARHDYRTAERYMRQAVAIALATEGPNHVDVGIHRLKLGRALARQQRWREAEAELVAGYAIVARQSAPSSPWLARGRDDLATVYTALGRPEEASKYRVAMAGSPTP